MPANRFDTLVPHAGAAPDPSTGARATPIYQTTYVVLVSRHRPRCFALHMERSGHVYSRISNPTVAVFEERVTALEGGAGAIGTASGQGAGSHVVASSALYGDSHNLLHYTGASGSTPRSCRRTIPTPGAQPSGPTRDCCSAKHWGNPGLDVLDIGTIAEIAHSNHLPLLVDSTFTTPHLLRPFDHGADFVYHSATKFLGGHGTTIGGVLVDGGTFDFTATDLFPEFTEPYDGFHGMVFAEESHRRAVPAARPPRRVA